MTTTTTTYTPNQLAATLATLTGDPWTMDTEHRNVHNLIGGALPIWFHGQGWTRDDVSFDDGVTGERMTFKVDWPRKSPPSACSYLPRDTYGDNKPDFVTGISVATSRGAVITAREIVRRLITPNVEMYAALIARKSADETHTAGKRQTVLHLAEALGIPARPADGWKPDLLSAFDLDFEVNGPDSISIKSYGLPFATVLTIVAALKEDSTP